MTRPYAPPYARPYDGTAPLVLPAPLVEVFLSPGVVHCTSVPSRVTTILGSCVAVCLWDRVRRVGGINHFILPYRRDDRPSPRFGDIAIARLIEEMQRLGCDLGTIRAKVFGGAAVLPFASGGDPVGEQNVRVAMERLRERGVPVIAQRTGGRCGLLIRLFTESGDVLVRRVASIAIGTARPPRLLPSPQNWPPPDAGYKYAGHKDAGYKASAPPHSKTHANTGGRPAA